MRGPTPCGTSTGVYILKLSMSVPISYVADLLLVYMCLWCRVLRVSDVCNGVLRVAVWDHNDVTSHQLIAHTTLSTAGMPF
jgi:hypothetical protein